jgi:hypothetical protein
VTSASAFLPVCALAALAAACGPASNAGLVDAGAGPADAAAASGLGAPCTREDPSCPSDYPDCVFLSESATDGFCSRSCGTSPVPAPGSEPAPPPDGQELCEEGYEGSARAACAVMFAPEDGLVPWACGLACGSTPEGNFGTCPDNLTCVQDDPDRNGYCLP